MINELRVEVRTVKESLDTIRFKLDKFDVWAALLRTEHIDMQQRLALIKMNAELVKSL